MEESSHPELSVCLDGKGRVGGIIGKWEPRRRKEKRNRSRWKG